MSGAPGGACDVLTLRAIRTVRICVQGALRMIDSGSPRIASLFVKRAEVVLREMLKSVGGGRRARPGRKGSRGRS